MRSHELQVINSLSKHSDEDCATSTPNSDFVLDQQVCLPFADAVFQFSQVSCQTVHIL